MHGERKVCVLFATICDSNYSEIKRAVSEKIISFLVFSRRHSRTAKFSACHFVFLLDLASEPIRCDSEYRWAVLPITSIFLSNYAHRIILIAHADCMQIDVMCAMPAVPRRYLVRYSLNAYMSRRRQSRKKKILIGLFSREIATKFKHPSGRRSLKIYDRNEKELNCQNKDLHGIRATTWSHEIMMIPLIWRWRHSQNATSHAQ